MAEGVAAGLNVPDRVRARCRTVARMEAEALLGEAHAHGAALRREVAAVHEGGVERVEGRRRLQPERERAVIDYAVKLTRDPAAMTADDPEAPPAPFVPMTGQAQEKRR